ncbi:MAG: MFS transporter [Gammaproteobacteria bacterium]
MSLAPDTNGRKFGPFWLVPGVQPLNAATFFTSSFLFVVLMLFLGFVQPYLLNDMLGVPAEQQGTVTGRLSFVQELTALLLMGLVGALSDRVGRRVVCVAGLSIIGLGFVLYPFADSIMQLYAFRIVIAVGVAATAVMIIAAMQDYPQEVSRAKWGGTNSLVTSFGILLVSLVLARLPYWLEEAGYPTLMAGRYTFWFGAAVAILAAVLIRFGWYGGRFASAEQIRSPFEGLKEGLAAGKKNPRLALSYIGAFAGRGDIAVIGAFFSLWFVRAGALNEIPSAEALKQGGITLGTLTLATMIWAPLFGWLLDKIDRVLGLAIAMTMACAGYFIISMVDNPFDMRIMMPATMLLGVGEISAVIASNALLGSESPPAFRGAASGVFSLVGTFGILFATVVGGLIFDNIGFTAPFAMMALANGTVMLLAVLTWRRWPTSPVHGSN